MNVVMPTGVNGRILAAGLALLLLIAIWFVSVAPLIGWYESRADTLAEQASVLHRMKFLVAQLPSMEKQMGQTGQAPAPDQFLPGATDAIAGGALEQQVQAMVSQNGATLSTAEVLDPEADGSFRRIQLRVTIASSWPQLIQLLAALTSSQPAMLVDDLQLSAAQFQGQAGNPPINTVFTVVAFRDAKNQPDPLTSP